MASAPTIAAIATGPAAGGVGIIRVSGHQCLEVVRRLCPTVPSPLPPREAVFTRFVGADQSVLDEGLVLYFPAPHSYTGEDVVELQVHGAPRLLQVLLQATLEVDGVRLAEPGEFTRRAFLSGRIDLARAEAVADLISATSTGAVQAAALQLVGGLSKRIEAIREPLVALHADLEAALDFPEESEDAQLEVSARLEAAWQAVTELRESGVAGEVIRRGARVVLYGPVNAGKSTLFNRLVGDGRAIVDSEPGTTRDALEAKLELSGLGITLVDTAGLRDAPGRVEAIGIERTRQALSGADVAVLVMPPGSTPEQLAAWQAEVPAERRLEVEGKADVRNTVGFRQAQPDRVGFRVRVSGETGLGLPELRAALLARLAPANAAAVLISSERHLSCLAVAAGALGRARAAVEASTLEVVAGEVGLALTALGDITGRDVSADLLDAIFQRFCIGK